MISTAHRCLRQSCGSDPVQCTGPRLIDRMSLSHSSCRRGCVARLPFVAWPRMSQPWGYDVGVSWVMGVPPVIHVRFGFSLVKHSAMGVPHFRKSPSGYFENFKIDAKWCKHLHSIQWSLVLEVSVKRLPRDFKHYDLFSKGWKTRMGEKEAGYRIMYFCSSL